MNVDASTTWQLRDRSQQAASRVFEQLRHMIVSLTEEADAIDWYEQRMALEKDKSVHAIMGNAQRKSSNTSR